MFKRFSIGDPPQSELSLSRTKSTYELDRSKTSATRISPTGNLTGDSYHFIIERLRSLESENQRLKQNYESLQEDSQRANNKLQNIIEEKDQKVAQLEEELILFDHQDVSQNPNRMERLNSYVSSGESTISTLSQNTDYTASSGSSTFITPNKVDEKSEESNKDKAQKSKKSPNMSMFSPKNIRRSFFGKKSHRERDAERIEQLSSELESQKTVIETMEDTCRNVNKENELLKIRVEKLNAQVDDVKNKMMDVESRNRDLERTIEAAQEELEENEKFKIEMEGKLAHRDDSLCDRMKEMELQLKRKTSELEKSKECGKNIVASKQELRLTLKKLANSVANLKDHRKELTQKDISHIKIDIFVELDEILKDYRDWVHESSP